MQDEGVSKLREYRDKRGVKAGVAADYLGMSYPTFAKYEHNPDLLNYQQLSKLAEFYSISTNQLYNIIYFEEQESENEQS